MRCWKSEIKPKPNQFQFHFTSFCNHLSFRADCIFDIRLFDLVFSMIIWGAQKQNQTNEIKVLWKIHKQNERKGRRRKTTSRNVPIQRISVILYTDIYWNLFQHLLLFHLFIYLFFTWCFSFQKESEHWLNFTLFQKINQNICIQFRFLNVWTNWTKQHNRKKDQTSLIRRNGVIYRKLWFVFPYH